MRPRIFVVDDDPMMRDLIGCALRKFINGVCVNFFSSANGVIEAACADKPNLVILDWILSHGQTGLGLCEKLKLNPMTRRVSVLVVSGQRVGPSHKTRSLAHGADYYLTKPFALKELACVAKALIQKNSLIQASSPDIFQIGRLVLNRSQKQVHGPHGAIRRFPEKLFNTFWLLAKNYPRTVATTHLIRYVWNNAVKDAEASVAVSRLKKRLDPKDCAIESVAGEGYRLILPG